MSDDILAQLTAIVGEQRVLTGDAIAAVEFPWGTHTGCVARAIVEPETTDEVAAIMRCCNDAGQSVVPFGGLTNLVQAERYYRISLCDTQGKLWFGTGIAIMVIGIFAFSGILEIVFAAAGYFLAKSRRSQTAEV